MFSLSHLGSLSRITGSGGAGSSARVGFDADSVTTAISTQMQNVSPAGRAISKSNEVVGIGW